MRRIKLESFKIEAEEIFKLYGASRIFLIADSSKKSVNRPIFHLKHLGEKLSLNKGTEEENLQVY